MKLKDRPHTDEKKDGCGVQPPAAQKACQEGEWSGGDGGRQRRCEQERQERACGADGFGPQPGAKEGHCIDEGKGMRDGDKHDHQQSEK
ncbi:hypothetical protein [Luteimonas salinisoli]|nr:hypothetical protein [Luteimonas salinisoli]